MEVTTSKISLQEFATAINYLDPRSQIRAFNVNLIKVEGDKPSPIATTPPSSPTSKLMSVIPESLNGDNLIYYRDEHIEKMNLLSSTYSDNIFNYSIKLFNGTVITNTREFLRPSDEQDNITLYSTLDDYKDAISELEGEEVQRLVHPKPLSQIEAELLDTYDRLQHIPSS